MTDGLFTERPALPDAAPHDADGDRWNYLARGETATQRLDRNFSELLQEVRVAQVGVQLLLTFLFAAGFTPRFTDFSDWQQGMYIVALALSAASTALLMAPVSFHRMVFRRRLKRELVLVSNRLVFFGLMLLILALASAILLVTDVTMGMTSAVWVTAGVVGWFGLWWYVLPLRCRLRASIPEFPAPRDAVRR
jgi:Kef-type K+ transport system membrane component KefB